MEMEIEIKKAPLTKSILSQMLFIKIEYLEKATVLGLLVNVMEKYAKLMLLYYKGDYYLYDASWQKGKGYFYYSGRGVSRKKGFLNEAECDLYWKVFEKVRDEAFKNHIYI